MFMNQKLNGIFVASGSVGSAPLALDKAAVGGPIMSDQELGQNTATEQLYLHIPGEVWMPVPSEDGVLASSEGRVLLPPRYAPMKNGGYRGYFPKPRFGQVSRENKSAQHEYRIIMVKDSRRRSRQRPRKVHQLVCEAFHGPRPFAEAVVIHLDENAHNNKPENLKWGTQKENLTTYKTRSPEVRA